MIKMMIITHINYVRQCQRFLSGSLSRPLCYHVAMQLASSAIPTLIVICQSINARCCYEPAR